MSDNRLHDKKFYRGLKSAAGMALEELGGSTVADAISRLSRQQIEAGAHLGDDYARRFLPMDTLADIDVFLTTHGARPVITEHLAQLCGFSLTRLVAKDTCRGALARALREQGDVITAIGIAQADGEISQAENAAIRREAVEAIDALTALIAAIDLRKDEEMCDE